MLGYSLQSCVGHCQVIDCTAVTDAITAEFLATCDIAPGMFVLFKTKNSFRSATDSFWYDFVYVDAGAAQWLVDHGVKGVGIDYLGIERNQPEHETHKILLESYTPIIEGLRLGHVEPGSYYFMCLPLLIPMAAAAPARAILMAT
jgi:arylformamidase